jgi:MraZ protein
MARFYPSGRPAGLFAKYHMNISILDKQFEYFVDFAANGGFQRCPVVNLWNRRTLVLQLPFNTPLTMDPKGRVTLPTRLFGKLDGDRTRSLVWAPYQNHLRGYTPTDWFNRVEAPLMAEDSFEPAVAEKQRRRLGQACELELDPHGRFVLPTSLRQSAGLARDCVLVSILDRLELWDAERWRAWVESE